MTDTQKKAVTKTRDAAVAVAGCFLGVLADRLFGWLF